MAFSGIIKLLGDRSPHVIRAAGSGGGEEGRRRTARGRFLGLRDKTGCFAMATKTVKAANDVARKGLAVVLAALLCMPMTGLEYPAYADEAASDAVAGQDQSAQPQENEALTPPLFLERRVLC